MLSYQSPVLSVTPGETVLIRATLKSLASDPTIITNAGGIVQLCYPYGALNYALYPYQQQFKLGFPPLAFETIASWQAPSANPLANLVLPPSSSITFDLGSVTISDHVAPGIYTTDIGIQEGCPSAPPGSTISCFFNPYARPSYDAGPLTFIVQVPEPSALAVLAISVAALLPLAGRRIRA